MQSVSEPYEYVLYIDEAGDDGLRRVRPIDEVGGSEWLIISGVLIRQNNEANVVDWVKEIRSEIKATQGPALHFRHLSLSKKLRACEFLTQKEVVCFVVCSNKKNMRGWRNERAEIAGGKQWFYNFCVRCLMERVTEHCYRDSMKRYGHPRYLKVVFSQRGGHSYGQTKAYWELLKNQAAGHTTYLKTREICPDVLRFNLVDYVPHTSVAGLQLADVVASAFYQASDILDVKINTEAAKILHPKMKRENGKAARAGVVLLPNPFKANLLHAQKEIYSFYGYRF